MDRLLKCLFLLSFAICIKAETVRVTSILVDPFLKRVDKSKSAEDPEAYAGYIKDVLDNAFKMMNMTYTFSFPPDRRFGMKKENGSWDGMMGQILEGKADLAAAPLTMTSMRRDVVQFTSPILSSGPVIVMRRPSLPQPNLKERLARLFAPFEQSVWMMTFLAYLVTSTVVYVISYINPYEWRRMARDGEANVREAESFNCNNSFWFSLSAMMWQGYVRTPRSLGGRLVVAVWWLFVTFFLITYTSSLTNMLRWGPAPLELQKYSSVQGLSDLAQNRDDMVVGALKGGATEQFLRNSRLETVKRVWQRIERMPSAMVATVEEGVRRVRTSPARKEYAFIMESAMATFFTRQEPCELYYVRDYGVTSMYGFAYKPDWPHGKALDSMLLQLREDGTLRMIEENVFTGPCGGSEVDIRPEDRMTIPKFYQTDLGTISGAFLVLLVGVVVGGLVSAIERCIFSSAELPAEGEQAEPLSPAAAEGEDGEQKKALDGSPKQPGRVAVSNV